MGADVGEIPEWSLGDRLRKARETRRMSQSELGEALGMTRVTVGRYETDVREPPRSVLMAWAMATGVPFAWIETGEAPSPGGDGASAGEPPAGIEPATYSLRVRHFPSTTCAA